MGAMQRRKGKRGESEARTVLAERDYAIIDTSDGLAVCDLIAERRGKRYAVEVKHNRSIDLAKHITQAKEQAKRLKCRWMLMARLDGYPYCFLVLTADTPPTVWRGKEARS